MSEQLLFIGTYAIPEGKLADFKEANKEMAEFVRDYESRLLSWKTYINADGSEATTIMIHPDSESLEHHLQVARAKISRGIHIVQTRRIDLYGDPSDRLVAQLHQMSVASGSWPVIVKSYLQGFSNPGGR
jgi:hypothetical protein